MTGRTPSRLGTVTGVQVPAIRTKIIEWSRRRNAVATIEQALDPSRPALFDEVGDNVVFQDSHTYGEVDATFARADRVFKEKFRQHRYANVPMETRGCVAHYDPGSQELTYYVATQSPHGVRFALSGLLNQPAHRLRVVSNDVGGAFGLKGFVYREDVAISAASKHLGQPVKWIEDRNEHLMASAHAREEDVEVAAAVTNDGMLIGLKASLVMNQGSYPLLPFPSAFFTAIIRRDDARPVQAAGLPVRRDGRRQQQGALRRLSRTVGSRDLGARAPARHDRARN